MKEEMRAVVHIVDDDSTMRNTLLTLAEAALLEARGYESANEFLIANTAESERPECLVLDIRMPEMTGIELLRELRANRRDIPVLLVSGHADVPVTIRGMKLGAVDLLQKPVEPLIFIEAVQRSLKISEGLKLEQAEAASVSRRFKHLTARELELLALVADGQSSKQIAVNLKISIKTVANHRTSLMAKTGATNAADLAQLFTRYRSNLSRRGSPRATEQNLPN
jgi:two-component system, LuxR family, response regulator FixJ